MYKSPVEILMEKMITQMDDAILKAVQAYHINVDKDELVKALRYDRDQYDKGYADGKRDAERVSGEWINIFQNTPVMHGADGRVYGACECSVCGEYLIGSGEYHCFGNYCPNCGAKMRGDTNAG